jgi:hypothetical protein
MANPLEVLNNSCLQLKVLLLFSVSDVIDISEMVQLSLSKVTFWQYEKPND